MIVFATANFKSSNGSSFLGILRKQRAPRILSLFSTQTTQSSIPLDVSKPAFLPSAKHCSSLGKKQLSLFVTSTAATGFILAGTPFLLPNFVAVNVGTLLCSFSANTFNQIYEKDTDKKMFRTKQRPLPSGRVSESQAIRFGLGSGILGTGILLTAGPVPALLGALNIGLYAGVYTPLKQKTELNTWVGSIVGAIPPLIGLTATSDYIQGNSNFADGALLATSLFLWQFPHFFALAFMNKDDYRRGGHKMVPVDDVNGHRTANLILGYSAALATLPFLAYSFEVTSFMFPLESILFNSYALKVAYDFKQKKTKGNARKVFLTSLWYLPLFMALLIFHRKDLLKEDDIVRFSNLGNSWLDQKFKETVESLRQLGTKLCVHEIVVEKKADNNKEKPFCISKDTPQKV
eukprot:maker-scaffold_38-snap-gene-1.19-mRNA-1 protein AED:0.01 eAED:0.01 QI:181/1/1/1/1/1/2/129/404